MQPCNPHCCDICHISIIIAFQAWWWCQRKVWFVLLYYLITKIYGLVKKSILYLNYWESYDNFIDFMAAILNFSLENNPLRMTALHRPRYYYGMLSMHNQKRNKLVSAKTRLPLWLPDHIDFTDKNTKIHFAPEYTRDPRQRDIFCPRVYSGSAFKGYLKFWRIKKVLKALKEFIIDNNRRPITWVVKWN